MAPYTFFESLAAEITIPEDGILSRTLYSDGSLKVIGFGFSAGQELSAHTAPMAAMLYFVSGDAELTLGETKRMVHAGAFVHMSPKLQHGILAKTPVAMVLWMLKEVR